MTVGENFCLGAVSGNGNFVDHTGNLRYQSEGVILRRKIFKYYLLLNGQTIDNHSVTKLKLDSFM